MDEKNITSWKRWKSILAPILQGGDIIGFSEETLAAFADRLGDFFYSHVDPKSPEQSMLKELWDVASPEEQRVLATLIVRAMKSKN